MTKYEKKLENRIEDLERKLEVILRWKDECKEIHKDIFTWIGSMNKVTQHDFLSHRMKIDHEIWMYFERAIEDLKIIDEVYDD